MKKGILLLIICLLVVGCSNQIRRYKNISDIVVGLYRSPEYDTKGLKANEILLIDEFFENLRSDNRLINIERFINYEDPKVADSNSPGVVIQNDDCHIDSNYLVFGELSDYMNGGLTGSNDGELVVVCKGYMILLVRDDVAFSYYEIINNPRHNYRYLGYVELENGYKFIYRSLYDSSGLTVTISDKSELKEITAEFEPINNIEYNTSLPVNVGNVTIYIIVFLGVIIGIVVGSKKIVERTIKKQW